MACPRSVNKIKRNTIADTWSLRIPLDFLIVSINLNAHNFILLSSFLHPVFGSFPWVILCHPFIVMAMSCLVQEYVMT